MSKSGTMIPASPAIVKNVIPEILQSEGALDRASIIARLRRILPSRGFRYSDAASIATTKKALSQLLTEGQIISRRMGWYELPQNPTTAMGNNDGEAAFPNTEEHPATVSSQPELKIEREIGEGPECVYVYFHDAHFELARSRGKTVWECKVGRTVGEPGPRIIGQGALTCFPRRPVIGLLIRTHDALRLERILHAALSYAGARIENNAGSEWFLTSPEMIERWFVQFKDSVNVLKEARPA